MDHRLDHTQRTLAAGGVRESLGLTEPEWRDLRAEAQQFRKDKIGNTSWGSLESKTKQDLCIDFRTRSKYEARLGNVEADGDPWASWFLLSTAKIKASPNPPVPSAASTAAPTSAAHQANSTLGGVGELNNNEREETGLPYDPTKPLH